MRLEHCQVNFEREEAVAPNAITTSAATLLQVVPNAAGDEKIKTKRLSQLSNPRNPKASTTAHQIVPNSVILRDKDDNAGWASAADGTLEERYYYCQNWRGDVVSIFDDSANQIEQVRYLSFGVPIGLPAGDT